MNYKGQPSNRIISRKFVEVVIIVLFVISLIFAIYLTVLGVALVTNNDAQGNYYFIAAVASILSCCVFLSFLIVNVLKVCELEKINEHLENRQPKQGATELLTLLADLQKREVITQDEYNKEKQRILDKM